MYSIADKFGVEYMVAKVPELFDGSECVIHTRWPFVVGRVHRFSRIESQEQRRQMVLERWKNTGAEYVQVKGMRMYIECLGALTDFGKTYAAKKLNVEREGFVTEELNGMAHYMEQQLNDGQRWALDDSLAIVDDDYFKEMRKHRRERMKEGQEVHGLKATAVYMDEYIPSTKDKSNAEPWINGDNNNKL